VDGRTEHPPGRWCRTRRAPPSPPAGAGRPSGHRVPARGGSRSWSDRPRRHPGSTVFRGHGEPRPGDTGARLGRRPRSRGSGRARPVGGPSLGGDRTRSAGWIRGSRSPRQRCGRVLRPRNRSSAHPPAIHHGPENPSMVERARVCDRVQGACLGFREPDRLLVRVKAPIDPRQVRSSLEHGLHFDRPVHVRERATLAIHPFETDHRCQAIVVDQQEDEVLPPCEERVRHRSVLLCRRAMNEALDRDSGSYRPRCVARSQSLESRYGTTPPSLGDMEQHPHR
jgi:hypothetical protein